MIQSTLRHEFPELFRFVDDEKVAVHYTPKYRQFAIGLYTVPALQTISFCPFSGRELPRCLREDFMDRIEGLDLEPFETSTHPPAFHSEEWWVTEGL
ncbi:MAG: hypothetical protein AAGH41_07320 [Pseudomonadota bacterium]